METFVVRVWRSTVSDGGPPADPRGALRGLVQHLGSGRSIAFRSGNELMEVMLGQLAGGDALTPGPGPQSGTERGFPGGGDPELA